MERSVERVVDSLETFEGEGFLVHRAFPTRSVDHVDPFLLFDEMGPADLGPGEAKGAPDHPHRGFETVTYVLSGRLEHRDSEGHHGRLGPGDVQWMTAGGGVIHSEMPEAEFAKAGGRMHAFQVWVNLPRRDKRMAPRYQELPAARIPKAADQTSGVEVTVIAGEALGTSAAIETRTPILYLHYRLHANAQVRQLLPAGFNTFAYVVEGEGRFGRDEAVARRGQLVLFGREGDHVTLRAGGEALGVLLLAGAPLDEPIARWGPFVMNTPEEIREAIADFRSGRLAKGIP